jgi:hypothetical protein
VNVDAVFDEDAEQPLVVAVAEDATTDAVRFDNPDFDRLSVPDRLERETADKYHGKNVSIFRDTIDEVSERGLEAREFFGVGFVGHGLSLMDP